MPAEPSFATIRLYLKPAVRKFVAGKLSDLHRAAGDQTAIRLMRLLEDRLGVKLIKVHGTLSENDDPRAFILLDVLADEERISFLESSQRERNWPREALNAMVNHEFYEDMYRWVDWYRARLHWSTGRSLEQYRRHYSISEEDYPFGSCLRQYQRHLKRKALVRPYRRA